MEDVVAIVVAAELQPQFVAKLLQMLVFTTLSPLLLLRGVIETWCKHDTNACVYDAVAIVVASDVRSKVRRTSVTNARVDDAVAIAVALDLRAKVHRKIVTNACVADFAAIVVARAPGPGPKDRGRGRARSLPWPRCPRRGTLSAGRSATCAP